MREITKEDFFFCYTTAMHKFIKENGISYLFKAVSVKDGNTFTLYAKNDRLQSVLDAYKKLNCYS